MRSFVSRIVAVAVLLLLFLGCQKSYDTDFRSVSIAYVKSLYGGYPYDIMENISISGTLTANGSDANLPDRFIIEDATGAIEVKSENDYLAGMCEVGGSVTLRCNGLCIGGTGGVVELGIESDDVEYQSDAIPSERLFEFLIIDQPTSETAIVYPEIKISDITPSDISRMVRISDLVVVADDYTAAWTPTTDTVINLSAVDPYYDTITLRIYGYCDFSQDKIPSTPIDVEGSIGYFSGYQLRLLDYSY